jgi:CO/xanthine dehydrogenase FAD-binding subunit
MVLWQEYHLAKNTTDALQALASAAGPARLIAGGTDLLLDLRRGATHLCTRWWTSPAALN